MILMQSPIDSDRTYQIFKREADNTTVCIEIVKGLQKSKKSDRSRPELCAWQRAFISDQ